MLHVRRLQLSELHWANERYDEIDFVASSSLDFIALAEWGGERAGLGRIVPVADGIGELGGMYVLPAYRGKSIAAAIVRFLLDNSPFERLFCIPFAHLETFYGGFGFAPDRYDGEIPDAVAEKFHWCRCHYSTPVRLLVRGRSSTGSIPPTETAPPWCDEGKTEKPFCSEPGDLPGWLLLAKEVEPLFGPMVEDLSFHEGLRKVLAAGNAFCVRNGESTGVLQGGIVISPEANEILWFAVARTVRGQGIGRILLKEALEHLDRSRDMTVTTFDGSTVEGIPARRLYRKFGFVDSQPGGPNPAGISTVIMVRPCGDV